VRTMQYYDVASNNIIIYICVCVCVCVPVYLSYPVFVPDISAHKPMLAGFFFFKESLMYHTYYIYMSFDRKMSKGALRNTRQ